MRLRALLVGFMVAAGCGGDTPHVPDCPQFCANQSCAADGPIAQCRIDCRAALEGPCGATFGTAVDCIAGAPLECEADQSVVPAGWCERERAAFDACAVSAPR